MNIGRKSISSRVRALVLSRDNYQCRMCGRTSKEIQLEVDHIFPHNKGGTDDLDNLATLCRDCNRGKSDLLLRNLLKQKVEQNDFTPISRPNITFEINEDKTFSWDRHITGFNMVWGFGFTLKINNFKNDKPDYVRLKLIGNTNDEPWKSQHFIFHETKGKMDKLDEPFEIAPNKIEEVAVVLSQDYPEHSPLNNQKIAKPGLDTDTVVLIVSTESGVEQTIAIRSRLITHS